MFQRFSKLDRCQGEPNRPRSIDQYSGMATRLYGQISRLSSSSRDISKQNNFSNLAIKPRSHVFEY